MILAALIGSCLSFFCGFGLGTLLLPAFSLFFPLEVSVAAAAVVHMLNNIFKLILVGKKADWSIIKTFGLLSVVGALIGAFVLSNLSTIPAIITYKLFDSTFSVTPINSLIGLIIIVFAFLEILPQFSELNIPKKWLPAGGLISGFFGGLSGHQGALRSAFLMKIGLSKDAFIGTRVVCACLVDITRISVYATQIKAGWGMINPWLVVCASLAAFMGAWLGNKWMKKTELKTINWIVSSSLVVFGIALILGWIIK